MKKGQNQYWLLVVIAACFEVVWVMGLKHAEDVIFWAVTIAAIIVSFALLIYTAKKLPASTAYAVFVGLGTAGTVVCEMLLYDVPFRWAKMALIASLLAGIIGLKMVTPDKSESAQSNNSRGERT
ncbi:multidrug efflux SMR transporter [Paenibacillus alkaliterrae]|uniref:DMT family transporter n=1 Tax=Paenibacillus alkaliterrae TaxID=320909 RepID=UPI001F40334A|nr:multidrug efflux SMR transporter [Paenibacillus alkaliterrae]MCF2938240.1 multidrug efflux SMR transporter [Paenibacillus alkaliterrae]